jgi:hypothetical protein
MPDKSMHELVELSVHQFKSVPILARNRTAGEGDRGEVRALTKTRLAHLYQVEKQAVPLSAP